ncbi:MAG: hypothetical protein IT285_11925 [Bdellovibrionales bacterium]|nr:hypothetical protein [Bdellovibrionales bacterium]
MLERENRRLHGELRRIQVSLAEDQAEGTDLLAGSSCTVDDPREKGRFDAVPSDQVRSLLGRLQIVAQLMSRHGRAYDYRNHTTAELAHLLRQLDAASAPPSNKR